MIDSDVLNSDVTLTGVFANTHNVTIHSNDGKNNTKVYTSREDVFFSFPSSPFDCPVNYSRNGYRDRDTGETYGSTANKYFNTDKHFDCLYKENVPTVSFMFSVRKYVSIHETSYAYLTNFSYYPQNDKIFNKEIIITFRAHRGVMEGQTHICRFTLDKNVHTYNYEQRLDVNVDHFVAWDNEVEFKINGATSHNDIHDMYINVHPNNNGFTNISGVTLKAPWLLK